ncbi:MAG: 2-aminoethylphosphonate aminotransferase [Gammaproteobacteria bacterium]
MKHILLNPGPVTLSARERNALLKPDLCHREPEFSTLQQSIRECLLAVYGLDGADWAAILMTGSGTAAVEAMISSLVPRDGVLLVAENGVYGERIRTMAQRHGIDTIAVVADWQGTIDVAGVGEALQANPRVTHVAVVHHETTTGRLNELAPLAAACREHRVQMLIDTVSSFGAEDIDFAQWPVAACAATANKCLHGVPGTSFVLAQRAAMAAASPKRTLYLDLEAYLANQDGGGTPFTQSVQTFYALDEALAEFFDEGGWTARRARYRTRQAAIREKLQALGVEPLLPAAESSCVLQAFRLPAGVSYSALHDGLKARGFVIYAGQGKLAAGIFRISAMGEIGDADLARLLDALSAELAR